MKKALMFSIILFLLILPFLSLASGGIASSVGIKPNTVHPGDTVNFEIDVMIDPGQNYSIFRVNVKFIWSSTYSDSYTAITRIPNSGFSSTVWNIAPGTKVTYYVNHVPIPDGIQTHRYYTVKVDVWWCYGTDINHLQHYPYNLSVFVEKSTQSASNSTSTQNINENSGPPIWVYAFTILLAIVVIVGIVIGVTRKRKSKNEGPEEAFPPPPAWENEQKSEPEPEMEKETEQESTEENNEIAEEKQEIKYCPNCGHEVKPEWKVCPYCGYKLKED